MRRCEQLGWLCAQIRFPTSVQEGFEPEGQIEFNLAQLSDPLRYGESTVAATSDELGFLKLRYKEPGDDVSQLIETPIVGSSIPGTEANFAAAIAGFGQLLRNPQYLGDWGYDEAIALANANRGSDNFGYRTEATQLMRLAQSLSR